MVAGVFVAHAFVFAGGSLSMPPVSINPRS